MSITHGLFPDQTVDWIMLFHDSRLVLVSMHLVKVIFVVNYVV